jgi:hypothetical protein
MPFSISKWIVFSDYLIPANIVSIYTYVISQHNVACLDIYYDLISTVIMAVLQ